MYVAKLLLYICPTKQKFKAMTNEKKYQILGFNDEQCICDVCGKSELKGTYAIENTETGDIFRAGSTCGVKLMKVTSKEFRSEFKTVIAENTAKAREEWRNSNEAIEYNNALAFMNKTPGFESPMVRLPYIKPFSTALELKREQISAKYNVKYIY